MSPEEHLARALEAKTPRSRGLWARRGLASRARLDKTTHGMLLRQLYLSHFEQRHFAQAFEIAEQSLAVAVLPDVVHQDAARACVALGDVDGAAGHIRLAARLGPPSRRAFHWWTLGSIYFVAGRYEEAIGALQRAARWGTRDKPLYQGHLAVARAESGEKPDDFGFLIESLESAPAGQGYGRFVLGLLAVHAQRLEAAKGFLRAFVERTEHGRPALAIALEGELLIARASLSSLEKSTSKKQ